MNANRISYTFNFQGPSIVCDTACSAGITSIHMAVDSLLKGETTMAIAGASSVIIDPTESSTLSLAGMMSTQGKSRSLDSSADGYIRSEGAAILVLKKLSTAIKDGDSIHAVIRSSFITHDGHVSFFLKFHRNF